MAASHVPAAGGCRKCGHHRTVPLRDRARVECPNCGAILEVER